MQIIIRPGYKEDLSSVLGLVKELAMFEKAPNDVEVNIEDMQRDGFGDDPIFKFFVAVRQNGPRLAGSDSGEAEGKIVGMALYYIKYSTWKGKCVFLEDIIVTESYRRYKIGRQLFEAVVRAAKKLKVRRVEWQVLDWNTPAIKFYEKYDSLFLKEWLSCRLTEEQINNF